MNPIRRFLRRVASPAVPENDARTREAPWADDAVTPSEEEPRRSFERPQITLFDIEKDVSSRLADQRYGNVRVCSFGSRYIDPSPSEWVRPFLSARVSVDYAESEIFIIDMSLRPPHKKLSELIGIKQVPVMLRRSNVVVDPRPLAMIECSDKLDQALQVGSFFIIFVEPRMEVAVEPDPTFVEFGSNGRELSTWSFLPVLGRFNVRADFGREMQLIGGPERLRRLLQEFLPDSSFNCTFEPIRSRDSSMVPGWEVIATNRFSAPVAGLIRDDTKGIVLLLPRIAQLPMFLAALVADVIPTIAPHLYPHLQRLSWTTDGTLDLPSLRAMKIQLERLNEAHTMRVNDLGAAIELHRSGAEHLLTILTASGDELRLAVKKTFEDFGFIVVDVDDERATAGFAPDREDLRIDLSKPALLIETKGLNGHPSDDDALQVLKYVTLRRFELAREDIASLAVVNHQRMVSPWEREPNPFRPEILANAKARELGLLTTWDLYRLARNARALNWPLAALRATLFGAGRIEVVPAHYTAVGKVERVLEKVTVISIRVESGSITIGDHLAFESGIDFEEFTVASLQVNKDAVGRAEEGTLVGVVVPVSVLAAARVGARIYSADPAAFD